MTALFIVLTYLLGGLIVLLGIKFAAALWWAIFHDDDWRW